MSLLLVVLVPLVGAIWSLLVGCGVTAGLLGGSWYLYTQEKILLDAIYPAAAGFILYSVLTYMNYVREAAQRRQVRTAFAHYMSPALVEELARDPDRLTLGGEMRDMTLLFCDIRGFTAISELYKSDPQGLTTLINQFLTPMTDVILERHGTIDKYMGDCIMAFWNAPLDDNEHAKHACASALIMVTAVRELNDKRETEAKESGVEFLPINIGIGLNSGDCCVGNMGSEQRFDYSVLGDDVNLASRLEGQSKTYGVTIVVGENTHARAPEFAAIELDLIAVKGKQDAVRIYGLLGDEEHKASEGFKNLESKHNEMLAAYRDQQWQRARELVADCRKLNDQLGALYDLYDERITEHEANPPGADWDGVFRATTK